jgi:hypothetical protein
MGVFSGLKALDAYPKIRDDEFFQKTMAGGAITIGSSVIMVLLFLSELCKFLRLLMLRLR